MPRIDPIKLLTCLSVLLLPNGGIKSTDEVQRLAELMTKYSKKLVSKCIYIQILKSTETGLLDLFMGSGGWRLVHMWLTESIVAKNWPLVKELLELLLLCPIDIDRLKTNNCPKLVKELSKDENHSAIRALASKLVEQWLKTVKGEQLTPVSISDIPRIISDMVIEDKSDEVTHFAIEKSNTENQSVNIDVQDTIVEEKSEDPSNDDNSNSAFESEEAPKVETLPVLKITLKDGKQIISQVNDEIVSTDDSQDKNEVKDKLKSKGKDKSSERSSNSKSSSKHSSRSKSSSDRHHSLSKHSSNSSSKDKKRDKDRHSSSTQSSKSKPSISSSSSGKKANSSSKSKEDKNSHKHSSLDRDKNREKEKSSSEKEKTVDKEQKSQSPSIHKLGKIPKLSDVKREKPSISIEVRKPDDPKPKTVKTFHSKFRKHGLEEEVKPPPSRAAVLTKKPLPILPLTVTIPKRPSPIHNESPPEKRPKTIEIDKPGAIKLIPPKPKPMVLQESDMFMDALNASATNKKEPKKRKRRTSGSKDGTPNDSSPPHTPVHNENKSVPPRFYQDTLDEEESKDKSHEKDTDGIDNIDKKASDDNSDENIDIVKPCTLIVNGLKGALCYHKRKGPKKSIRWKPDSELEQIQYFELDETERVNVTKTFTDMKHLERINEREAFEKARNLTNDDVMEEKTNWKKLIVVDCDDQVKVDYGKNSKEKDIQAIRQKGTLQPLYFHKTMIPDSALEPDLESHPYSEPMTIPLEDVTGNVSDFRNMPWPEPKGNAPPTTSNNINVPSIFPSNISQFPNTFPPAQFPGVPGFQGPPMMPGDWQSNVPPVMPNGLTGPMGAPIMPPGPIPPGGIPPGNIPPGAMPPGMLGPPDPMMMGPKLFSGPNPLFPGPPDGFNMPQNLYPGDFSMSGPPGTDGFSGPGNFRGALRGRGHWRGKTNGNFDGPPRGRGGGRGGRKGIICTYFQRRGSCRQGDNCTYLHPGVNCPF